MSRHSFTSALVCLSLVCTACAKEPRQEPVLPGEGSVWVVESPTTKVYLCGTIHLLRSQDYPLPKAYDAAYADSQRLVYELPPGSAEEAGLAEKMRVAGSYPAGQVLSDKVKPETWKALSEWSAKRRMAASNFNSYRPWFVALNVTAMEYAAVGAEHDRGVDFHFEAKAKKDRKPGAGLETVEFQIGLFANLSEPKQQELLEQTLQEVKQVPEQYSKLVHAWRQGDVETLHAMLFEEAKDHPDLMDLFLVNRNKAWIAPLEGYLRGTEHVMVLVGTGHLGGSTGVMKLLQDKGYRIRRVPSVAAKAGE